jgi:hypothetical protein
MLCRQVNEQQQWFQDLLRGKRNDFESDFPGSSEDRQRVADWMRSYCRSPSLVSAFVCPLYRAAVGRDLPEEEIEALLGTVPELSALLLVWGYAFYSRAVAESDYGRKNAGLVDLWFATYLPRTDCFVTADRKQFRALRSIATIAAPHCRVLIYDEFRCRLVIKT